VRVLYARDVSFAPYHKCKTSKNSWSGWTEVGQLGEKTKQFTAARVLCSKDFNKGTASCVTHLPIHNSSLTPPHN
jgi:hypothetical protein